MLRRILPNRTTERVHSWMFWRWMEINGRKEGVEYLTRLYLINTPWFGLKIHWFHAPDPDEHCHDHPWWFISFLLKGMYQEKRQTFIGVGHNAWIMSRETEKQRGRFSFAFRRSTDVHRITMCTRECKTLILNGPRTKSWAFWEKDPTRAVDLGAWGQAPVYSPTPWRAYLDIPEETPAV